MNADADGVGFQVAVADGESRFCGMDFHLFGVRDLGFDLVGARNGPAGCAVQFAHRTVGVAGRRNGSRHPTSYF